MIRFAYSTNAYTKFPLAEAVEDIARAGFDGVEILADVPHAFPGTPVAPVRLPISNLNGNTNAGLDPEGRDPEGFWPGFFDDAQARIGYVKGVIDLARELGAENVCAASGRLPAGTVDPWGALVSSLREILAHAEPDVRLGIEAEPGFFLGDAAALRRLLREVHHPLLGLNLDIGHAVCSGDDPVGMIEEFRGRIWNLHFEDIRGGVHDHLIPGEGDIDFARILRALERTGYDRFVTLELYPYKDNPGEAGRRGLAHLRALSPKRS